MSDFQKAFRKVWAAYLVPGFLFAGVKFLSVFTWFFFQPIARVIGLSHGSFGFTESAAILGLGLIGAIIAILGWPFLVYKMAIGALPVSAALFYPWVNRH